MIVVEAAAAGVPSIVVDGPDNAAVELIEEGVNGIVSQSASPEDLAAAIVRVYEAGASLRASTRDWFERNARLISAEASLARILEVYREAGAGAPAPIARA